MAAVRRRLTPWIYGVGVVTFLAGLPFGYDQRLEEEPAA
jgi:hypothetical protein